MKLIYLTVLLMLITICFARIDLSLKNEVEHSIKLGLNYLSGQQEEDGSWQHYPAITALVTTAMLRSNPGIDYNFEPVAKALKFLAANQKEDGSISAGELPNYNTAICIITFKEAGDPQYKDLIIKAEKYLLNVQLDEGEGFTPDSTYYGGIGYDGSDNRPDMSNMQWVSEAFQQMDKETDIEKKEKDPNEKEKKLFYKKALTFLGRCQNLDEYNPESYSANDGGFIYEVGKSKAEGTLSYGTMTYVGLKSLIYAGLSKDDQRVKAAYNWLRGNFRVDEVPGIGKQGLFYYYTTIARTLYVYGEDVIIDTNNIKHNWRNELANQLISIQDAEGWWQNDVNRWWENNKVLVTAYSVLALEEILK